MREPPAQMKMTAAPHSATFSPPLFVPSSRAANGRARALDFWGMNNHRARARVGQPAGQRVDHVTCSMGRKEGRGRRTEANGQKVGCADSRGGRCPVILTCQSFYVHTRSTCVAKCRGTYSKTMRSKISLLNTLWQASRARDTAVHAHRWRHGIIIVLPV